MSNSIYNDTRNLNITYYFGAGASYNALPIWRKQGDSMVEVSNQISSIIQSTNLKGNSKTAILYRNEILLDLASKLQRFGGLAVEYGSIDVYAKRLDLLGDYEQLNELKYCLSVYFDLWEKFFYKGQKNDSENFYQQIDKRYYSLLSILLQKTDGFPKLNEKVSIISWNYDLQFEMAYASFLPNKTSKLEIINQGLKFKDDSHSNNDLDIVHLNGYRGEFKFNSKTYQTVEDKYSDTIENYLYGLLDNHKQFRLAKLDYKDCIKYAWEENSKSIARAEKIMKKTNILIIVGYSFPSFNRHIDSKLIKAFQKDSYSRVIYQDPYASQDIVNSIFRNPKSVELKTDKNSRQFYIPNEYLSPSEGERISFGV